MKLRNHPLVVAAVCFVALTSFSNAAVILAWEFAGLAGNEPSAGAATVDPNLQATSITRGAGLIPRTEAGMFSARSWPTAGAGLAGALAGDDFMEWSITPQAGASFSLESLEIKLWRVNSFFVTGPNTFHLRSSLDGFASDLGAPLVIPVTNLTASFDLSTVAGLQGSSSPVTFRLYGYGTDGADGWGGIGRASGDDIIFNGSVIPEPSRAILALVALGSAFMVRRRN